MPLKTNMSPSSYYTQPKSSKRRQRETKHKTRDRISKAKKEKKKKKHIERERETVERERGAFFFRSRFPRYIQLSIFTPQTQIISHFKQGAALPVRVMENIMGSSNIRNASYSGKHPFLPPKIPFPSPSPSYVDYVPNSLVGPKGFANTKDVNSHHQRTSSESILLEEQPSWLDELLNEPDTPVRKGGHRRSSSDSFAYIDVSSVSLLEHGTQHEYKHKNMISAPSWGSQDFERYKEVQHSFYPERHLNGTNWAVDPSLGHSTKDCVVIQSLGSSSVSQEADGVSSTASQKKDLADSGLYVPKSNYEWKDPSNAKASDSDTKRAKQQFAQRSRVRKLQYIAELENNVQALQAEGSEISAELEFVNQQNLILNMENKTLKQRLDSLAQEQLIKYMEHEMLEREVGRLRTVGQQHKLQSHQPPSSSHRRTTSRDLDSQHRRINSKDLDSQFSNLSLKHHKDVGWGPLNS